MLRDAAGAAPGAAAVSLDAPAQASPRRVRGFRRCLALLAGMPLLAPALGFLWFLAAAQAPPTEPERRTDGIAVLTGGAERVRTGLLLLMEDRAGRLLVSGAHPDVTLADLATVASVPVAPLRGRVTLGHAARSTRGNAAETAAWVRAEGLHSIRLVTAGYHMPRATLELRRALPPDVEILPHPVLPAGLRDAGAPARPRIWSLLLTEYAKLVGAALGLSRPDPAPSRR